MKTENAKVFLIGGVRLQWRRSVGWRAGRGTVPLPQGVQSIVALKAARKKQAESGKYRTRHRDHYQTAARIYSTRPMNEPWKTLR